MRPPAGLAPRAALSLSPLPARENVKTTSLASLMAALLAALLLGGACGRPRARGAEYDLARSEALLDIGDALLEHPEEAATEALWRRLDADERLRQNEAFRELARLNEDYRRQRELFAQARRLLDQGRYNDLAAAIDAAEQRGEVTHRLLALRDLPQALLALKLYCARRPYQSADDIGHALDFLQPYRLVLDTSPAFREFIEKQLLLQEELAKKERAREVAAAMARLDLAIAAGAPDVALQLMHLRNGHPEAPLAQFLTADGSRPSPRLQEILRTGALPPQEERAALELALAVCRPAMDAAEREASERLLRALPENETLTGTALKGACLKDASLLEKAIAQWNERQGEDAPAFLPAYLSLCGVDDRAESRVDVGAAMELLLQWAQSGVVEQVPQGLPE